MHEYLVVWGLTENFNGELSDLEQILGVLKRLADKEIVKTTIKYGGYLTKNNLPNLLNDGCPNEFLKLFKGKFDFNIRKPDWITILITEIMDTESFKDERLYFTQNYNGSVKIEHYSLCNNEFGKKSLKSLL